MINYIIINGTNSNTINGLGINELPPISKPPLRVQTEEIDGRDGDISTNLGYGAYDKTISIGLFGTGYDINEVISFFNGEGTVVFSNEPNKYYKYKIINQIDYEALLKFKSATITFHCQPFKYPTEETPLEIEYEYIEQDNVESASINNTNGDSHLDITLKGNTSQDSTTGKNLLDVPSSLSVTGYVTKTLNLSAGTYVINCTKITTSGANPCFVSFQDDNDTQISAVYLSTTELSKTITPASAITKVLIYSQNNYGNSQGVTTTFDNLMVSSSGGDYEPYTGGQPSPSPSFPQQIHEVSGDNEVVVCGKNRLNKATCDNDKLLAWTSGNTANETNSIASDYIRVNTTEQYSFTYWGQVMFYDKNKNYLGCLQNDTTSIAKGTGTTVKTLTVPSYDDIYYMRLGFRSNAENDNVNMNTANIMVNKGTTLLPYEPYNGDTYELSLGDIKMRGIGTYEDYFTKNSGKNLCKSVEVKGGNTNVDFYFDNTIPKTITLSATLSSQTHGNSIYLNIDGTSKGIVATLTGNANTKQSATITLSDENYQAIQSGTNMYFRLYRNNANFTLPTDAQIEKGSTATTYEPYGTGQWCKYNAIGEVVLDGTTDGLKFTTAEVNRNKRYSLILNDVLSQRYTLNTNTKSNYFKYNTNVYSDSGDEIGFIIDNQKLYIRFGSTSELDTITKANAWLSTHNTQVDYPLATPYLSLIEDTTLINQLDNIQNAMSYDGTTNVSQVNNDKPFLLDLIAMEKGTDEVVINNIGNVYAKPTIALEGTGETDIYLNNTEILKVDLSEKNKITIDTNNMEAYVPTDNSLANRKVIGNYNSMTLPSGNTTMKITGALDKATITNYQRWL